MTVLRSRRALVALVLVLLAAVVVGLLLVRAGGGDQAGAAPTGAALAPAATGTATSPSATPSDGATASPSPSPSSRSSATASPTTTRPAAPGTTSPAPRTTAPKPPATKKPGTSTPTPPPPATTSASEAREVLRLTNVERASAGCSALAWDSRLAAAAAGHSTDMASHDYFSHTSRDGRSFSARITAAGYGWSRVAENIAAGQPTPKAVVAAWMDSDGHRANILNCALTELGVGVARSGASGNVPYWTQDFGTPR